MEFVIGVVVLFVLGGIFISSRRSQKKTKLQILKKIKENWKTTKKFEIKQEQLDFLYRNYQYQSANQQDIDDLTWNNLEMDGIFTKINHAQSTMGEIYLYNLLRKPINQSSTLQERNGCIEQFRNDAKLREAILYQLNKIGCNHYTSFYESLDEIDDFRPPKCIQHILCILLEILSVIFCFYNIKYGVISIISALAINLFVYFQDKAKLEVYLPTILEVNKMIQAMLVIQIPCDYVEIREQVKTLKNLAQFGSKMNRLCQILRRSDIGMFDSDTLMDYLRIITHMDMFVFPKVKSLIIKNKDLLCSAYEAVGYLDAMISIAQFREELSRESIYCIPSFIEGGETSVSIIDVINPLLEQPIENSLTTSRSILITGSNATGKSTFLRTIGVNVILAQTIDTVCAKSYHASFFRVMASMNLKDDIYSQESYYMREIRSIKRILDVEDSVPILCCLDEVLRGTNTLERIGAASKILEELAKKQMLCIVASHDIELTVILKNHYENFHFQEVVNEEGIFCDYILYPGNSKTRNAINLLKLMGYSDQIVNEAKNRVNSYIQTGEWSIVQ